MIRERRRDLDMNRQSYHQQYDQYRQQKEHRQQANNYRQSSEDDVCPVFSFECCFFFKNFDFSKFFITNSRIHAGVRT